MKFSHSELFQVIYIPFRGVGTGDKWRDDGWFWRRVAVFKATTLKSLEAQTTKSFLLWMSFRPEDKEHEAVASLHKVLEERGIKHVFTFEGLMYYDDKFTLHPFRLLKNSIRVVRNAFLHRRLEMIPGALLELFSGKNRTLRRRLATALAQVGEHIPREAIWIYMTRIDSDDMLRKDALATIKSYHPAIGLAIVMKEGFMWNLQTNELAHYSPKTNPPFHTIIFPRATFLDFSAHIAYYGNFKSHEDVTKIFRYEILYGSMYCVTVNDPANHISTAWSHPFRKDLVQNPEEILSKFGVFV